MKKIIKKILIVLIILGIVFVGYCVYNNYFRVLPMTYSVKKGDYQETIKVKGTINTINSAEVHSKSTNTISKVLVKQGDVVKSGDILAYLNDNKIHEYERAELNYKEAKRNYEIAINLYNSGDISKDEYIKTENAMKLTKVALDALEIEDDLVVKAPIDGVITKIDAKIGMVAGSLISKRLFQIEDISKLQIKVEIKEKDLYKVKEGQVARITAEAMGERVFYGKVSYISSVGEASSNNNTKKVIEAIIDINENEKDITAGVSAKADIIINEYKDVLIIPIECHIEEMNASYVNVLNNNKKEKREIKPLVIADDEFIIADDGIINIEDKVLGVE